MNNISKLADWTRMHEDELWQVFQNNGLPVIGIGATPDEFKVNPELLTGNVHVWLWRESPQGVEILLQKRSLTKSNSPGMYFLSAGGHINLSESSVQAAVRETFEELGVELEQAKLHYVHSIRVIERHPNDIKHIYLYKLQSETGFTFQDGEVDSVEWRTLENFKIIVKDPDSYNLLNQGQLYYDTLLTALDYVISRVK
jgi:8-oxo-dGTP pyrophosphatase MutT (NUDIX family)